MTKKEFIESFHLTKGEKITVKDGTRHLDRVAYLAPNGDTYIFCDGDLAYVRTYDVCGEKRYRLVACYSWYR